MADSEPPNDNLQTWLQGKKTYLTAAAILACGVASRFWGWEVPEFLWAALAALGLTFLRAGVESSTKK